MVRLDSPTLASLRYFAAAASFQSFKRAAEHLHVTQGAVSQQVKRLEEVLDVQLFLRLPQKVRLTEAGRQFYRIVDKALGDILSEMQTIASRESARNLRIRTNPSLAVRWLVPKLGHYYRARPLGRLSITGEYGPIDHESGSFDIAIESLRAPPEDPKSEWLMDELLIPVCSPAYLAERPWLISVQGLSQCEFLHDAAPWAGAAPDAEWRYWLDHNGGGAIISNQGQFFSLAYMSIEAALNHQGVAVGRISLVADLVSEGRLIELFGPAIESPTKYWLLFNGSGANKVAIQEVAEWLHSESELGRSSNSD